MSSALKSLGINTSLAKLQNGVHNKGVVIDSSIVALGSGVISLPAKNVRACSNKEWRCRKNRDSTSVAAASATVAMTIGQAAQ